MEAVELVSSAPLPLCPTAKVRKVTSISRYSTNLCKVSKEDGGIDPLLAAKALESLALTTASSLCCKGLPTTVGCIQ